MKLFMVICLLLLARFQLGTSRNICSKSSSPTLSDLNRVSFKDSIYILEYKLRGWFIIRENTVWHIFLQRKNCSFSVCNKLRFFLCYLVLTNLGFVMIKIGGKVTKHVKIYSDYRLLIFIESLWFPILSKNVYMKILLCRKIYNFEKVLSMKKELACDIEKELAK